MGIKLKTVKSQTASIKIKVADESAKVVYRPNALTPETLEEMRDLQESNQVSEGLVLMVCAVIKSWELLDEKGKALPVNAETVRTVPVSFLSMVIGEILKEAQPEGEAPASLGAG